MKPAGMDIDNLDWGPDEVQVLMADAEKAVSEQRYADAEPLLIRAYDLLNTPKGGGDPDLANCLQKLSEVYCGLDDFERAAPVFEKLLSLGERMLGRLDPDIIVISFRLATAYELVGRNDEAGNMYARAVQNAEEGLGTADPLTKRFRDGYAAYLERRARPQKGDEINFSQQAGYGGSSGFTRRDSFKATRELELELDALPEDADGQTQKSKLPFKTRMMKQLSRWGHIFIPVICSFILLIGAGLWMQTLVHGSGTQAGEPVKNIGKGSTFKSIDKTLEFNIIDEKQVEVICFGKKETIPYVVLSNGLLDATSAMEGYFVPRERWFELKDDCIKSDDGGVLYAAPAIEWKVKDGMLRVADYCQKYFATKGTYPSNSDRWLQQIVSKWISPLTGRAEIIPLKSVSMDVGLSYIFNGSDSNKKIDEYLSAGGLWTDEPKAGKCAITTMSIFGTDKSLEGFKSRNFYIHGYDRNAAVLPGATPKSHFYIYLENGEDMSAKKLEAAMQDKTMGENLMPKRICLVKSKGEDPFLLKNAGPTLVGAMAGFFLLLWMLVDLPSRIKREGDRIRLLEILLIPFVILFGIWHLLRFLG